MDNITKEPIKNWEYLEDDILSITSGGDDFGITEDDEVMPCDSMSNCYKCIFYNKEIEDCNIKKKFDYLYRDVESDTLLDY